MEGESAQHEKKERVYSRRTGGDNATGTKPPTGYLIAIMHLVKGYIGTGIFAIPQAFKNSGMGIGPPLLLFIGFVNLHCQHLLIAASQRLIDEEPEEDQVKPTFGETVEYTFDEGPAWWQKHSAKMAHMVNIFVMVTEFGFCCCYYVFISDHLVEILHTYNIHFKQREMLAIILIPMWITTFLGNLKLLAPLSIFANTLLCITIIFIFYFTSRGLGAFPDKGQVWYTFERLPLYFGTALYAYEGITFVLPLRNEMANPRKQYDSFFGVLNVGIFTVAMLMCAVGILSYWKFGDHIEPSVFLNLPEDEVMAQVAKILICIAIVFTFTLHMYIPFEVGYPLFYAKYGPFKHPYLIMTAVRAVPVLATFTLAMVVPYLGLIISLVGASTASFLALILPPILELVGRHGKLPVITRVKDYLIITFGVVGAITGTILSIYDIALQIKKDITS